MTKRKWLILACSVAAAAVVAVVITLCVVLTNKDERKPAANYYTVVFDANGGTLQDGNSSLTIYDVKENTMLTEPATPSLANFGFVGWTVDGETLWNFDEDKIAGDTTLLAKWCGDKFLLSVSCENNEVGSIDNSANGSYLVGTNVALKAHPFPGYKFVGWFEENATTPYSTAQQFTLKMPLNALKLEARFDVADEMKSFTFFADAEICFITALEAENTANVVIPDYVTGFNPTVFQNNKNIKNVTIGGGVDIIPLLAFSNCSALEKVVIREGVSLIANNAFYSCTALVTVELPNSLSEIGDGAFESCIGLKNINFKGVNEIGFKAFAGCSALESVSFNRTLKRISANAFVGCSSLNSAAFDYTENWYVHELPEFIGGYGVPTADLNNPSKAAELLTSTHLDMYWKNIV